MELMRVLGVGIVGTLLAVTLARHNGGYGLLTGLATGALLLMMLLGQTEELGVSLRELTGFGQLSSEYLSRVVRILGLACLTEAGSRICRDGRRGRGWPWSASGAADRSSPTASAATRRTSAEPRG